MPRPLNEETRNCSGPKQSGGPKEGAGAAGLGKGSPSNNVLEHCLDSCLVKGKADAIGKSPYQGSPVLINNGNGDQWAAVHQKSPTRFSYENFFGPSFQSCDACFELFCKNFFSYLCRVFVWGNVEFVGGAIWVHAFLGLPPSPSQLQTLIELQTLLGR